MGRQDTSQTPVIVSNVPVRGQHYNGLNHPCHPVSTPLFQFLALIMNLEEAAASVKPSDETACLSTALIAALGEILKQEIQLSHAQIPESQKLWDNKRVSW